MNNFELVLATLLCGIATFWFTQQIVQMILRPLASDIQVWQHDEQRKNKLRAKSGFIDISSLSAKTC